MTRVASSDKDTLTFENGEEIENSRLQTPNFVLQQDGIRLFGNADGGPLFLESKAGWSNYIDGVETEEGNGVLQFHFVSLAVQGKELLIWGATNSTVYFRSLDASTGTLRVGFTIGGN